MTDGFRRCTRCVMDNSSDKSIVFDENGVCDYCTNALVRKEHTYFPDDGGQRFNELIEKVKKNGEGKKYDCVMGLSGGLDSSYLLYLGHLSGLRILCVHIEDGFGRDVTKRNIDKLVEATGSTLEVIYPDETQFNALTKAYFAAGVSNAAIPQDNILFACIYDYMKKNKLEYFLSGGNFALEGVLQRDNTYTAYDVVNIKDICRRFSEQPCDKLRFLSAYKKVLYENLYGIQSPRPLNYIDYNRDRALRELNEFCGFEYYGSKHLENTLTAFIQLCWLPRKFGFDKRTSHLSSMIVSGQMTRDEALRELEKPVCSPEFMEETIDEVKRKLQISDDEFERFMAAPTHAHTDYRTDPLVRAALWYYKLTKRH